MARQVISRVTMSESCPTGLPRAAGDIAALCKEDAGVRQGAAKAFTRVSVHLA